MKWEEKDQILRGQSFAERSGFTAGHPSKETGGKGQICLLDQVLSAVSIVGVESKRGRGLGK